MKIFDMAPMMRPLGVQEIETVHEWLRTMGMPVNRLLHRDYADGVLVAQLLKKLFPRYVEMHNYQRRYSQNLKIVNWRALESKILKRLGIKLTQDHIETLARGETGTIERLLWLIMKQVANGKTLDGDQRRKACAAALKEIGKKRLPKVTPAEPLLSRHQSFHSESGSEKNADIATDSTINTTGSAAGTINTTIAATNQSTTTTVNQTNQCNSLEKALGEFRAKIETLEELFKKRDVDIQTLLERERVNAAESPELKKILGTLKS